MVLLDERGIKDAFARHLRLFRNYAKDEVAEAISDFPDPYGLPYLDEEYIGEETIDGIEYEKHASFTDFERCGIEGIPVFRFYTYYNVEDLPSHMVSDYMSARKLYQVDDLNEDDFPL